MLGGVPPAGCDDEAVFGFPPDGKLGVLIFEVWLVTSDE